MISINPINRCQSILSVFLLLWTVLLLAGSAWAGEDKPQEPIHIEADLMVSRQQDKAVVFSGKVRAKQGELLINSDEMTVYYADDKGGKAVIPGGAGQVERIFMKGKVEIVRQGLVATGDQADYLAASSEVVLKGHAKIVQDNNMISGHVIKMNLDQGNTEIVPKSGSGGRVVGYFYPSKNEKVEEGKEGKELETQKAKD